MSISDTQSKEATQTTTPPAQAEVKESQNNNNNANQTNNPVSTGSPLVRLKAESPTPSVIKEKVDFKQDPEYQKLLKEHEELKQKIELEEQKKSYYEVIPRELFILNGKFDNQGYAKEVEKAVEKKLDPEYAKELYTLKLKNIQLNNKLGKPYGASTSNLSSPCPKSSTKTNPQTYQTPSEVPESLSNSGLKGASTGANGDSSQFQSIKNICRMFNLTSGGDY